MIRARTAAVVFALLLTLAGCFGDAEPTTSPSVASGSAGATTAPAATTTEADTPITDDATIRQVCNTIADLGNRFDHDANLAAGQLAERIADPKFSLPGRELVKAAGAASAAPGPDTNVDIAKAQLAFLDACGDRYGDGPW